MGRSQKRYVGGESSDVIRTVKLIIWYNINSRGNRTGMNGRLSKVVFEVSLPRHLKIDSARPQMFKEFIL